MQNAQEVRSYNKDNCWNVDTTELEVYALAVAWGNVVTLAGAVVA